MPMNSTKLQAIANPARRAGRPRRAAPALDGDTILQAALTLLEKQGEAFSMRALARISSVISFLTPTYSSVIMQLMTRKVMATIDRVILKLRDLDKSIAPPELMRAGKHQWLEFEILNPL